MKKREEQREGGREREMVREIKKEGWGPRRTLLSLFPVHPFVS